MTTKRETFTDEYLNSDDSDVLESFEIVLLVLKARGLVRVTRTDLDNGATQVCVTLFE